MGRRDELEALTDAEQTLLADLARHVAVVTHAALLDQALRQSLGRQVLAREEERRRLRRELHDGLGPTLAGVALGVDAARQMLRTAGQAAGGQAAAEQSTDDLLGELKDEMLGCVGEVRRIVDDLRPPMLDELGLLPALRSFADRLSTRDAALQVAVDSAQPFPDLPAAVEVAAFRIATEAMTNVARHARASTCRLRLGVGDELTIEVSDDGIGIPRQHRQGVGISTMTERATEIGGACVVSPAAGGGTVVLARLPLVTT